MSTGEEPDPKHEEQPRTDTEGRLEAASDAGPDDRDDHDMRELRPEDQARVDAFLKRGVNSVDRKPFRPVFLMIMLIVVVAGLSFLAQGIARMAGVY